MHRNLELKARHSDLAAACEAVRQFCDAPASVEVQCDTYFHVAHGRLKLREIEGREAVLIAYARPDREEARTSAYHLVPIPDPDGLKSALTAALGVRGVVRKRRQIILWQNVRVHLDEVAGLGSFVELEAVLAGADDEAVSRARLDRLCERLGLVELLGPSYADLLGVK